MWRELGVDAGAAEEQKFSHAIVVSGPDDVVLHLCVLEQKLNRQIAVRLDPADFRRREKNQRRLLLREETGDVSSLPEVERGAVARHDMGKPVLRELANERAADQAPVAGHEYFLGFFHEPRRSAVYHFLFCFNAQSSLRGKKRSPARSPKDL